MTTVAEAAHAPRFAPRVHAVAREAAVPERTRSLMLNVGLRCPSACPHCHHACSMDRTEVMSRATMLRCVSLAERLRPELVDVTGGEPALFEHLDELLIALADIGVRTRVRTNTVTLGEPSSAHLLDLFAERSVGVLASLPGTSASAVTAQRGAAAWDASLEVLLRLNVLGYGATEGDSRLRLDLAYNPPLGELPRPQKDTEADFRAHLADLGIRFDSLLSIANVPVGRFGDRLRRQGGFDPYLMRLAESFNPATVRSLECRHGVEVAWDGTIWDCDFNLAADTRPTAGPRTIEDVLADVASLDRRRIGFAQHCFACTSGAGSG